MHDTSLQLILPTDKRNPSFSLYRPELGQQLHVYYGLELLEIVPDDADHGAYKLLVGRLYNAGVKVAVLEKVFQTDRKTMRRWGQALVASDPEQLQRVLLGREVHRKCTPAVENFVRRRWASLQAEGCPHYRRQLLEEIQDLFGVKLSGESLRLLLRKFKDQASPTKASEAQRVSALTLPPADPAPVPVPDGVILAEAQELGGRGEVSPAAAPPQVAAPVVMEEMSCSVSTEAVGVGPGSDPDPDLEEMSCSGGAGAARPPASASKSSPPTEVLEPGATRWCDHAGLLWFASGLAALPTVLTPPEPVLAQWLGSILLGAMNLEQTKYLNLDDLSLLLGEVVRFPTPQRVELKRLCTLPTVDAVLRWNLVQLGVEPGTDLYLDPHTKHYTGEQNVLKGWCASIRWADKALHSDFVHTAQGHPIYFECVDNFEDLRARFLPLVARMRASLQWSADKVLTMVLDRAIFGEAVFEEVIRDPTLHLITWQKGYEPEPWEPSQLSGSFAIKRCRNCADDLRLYRFEYVDRPWPGHPGLRQIVVRATHPEGRTNQVAVLTDDLHRPAQEILRLIFNRWLQENDFKYLDKHFGINQLTSYQSIDYAKLKGQLTDRQVQSQAYRRLLEAGRAVTRQQARVLLLEEQARRLEARRQERIVALEQPGQEPEVELTRAQSKELGRLRAASQRYAAKRQDRSVLLDQLYEQLQQNEQEREAAQKEVSRIDQLIAEERVRLDTRGKRLMDALKITARNLFYQALAPFKKEYDNYRDDHDLFRQLTLCSGVLRWTGQELEVHLVAHVNYSGPVRKIIGALMETLNARGLSLPDGSGRKLRFRLTRQEEIDVRIQLDPIAG